MATIGTFTANDNGELGGTIRTLTLNTQALLRPVDKDREKSPDFRRRVYDRGRNCDGRHFVVPSDLRDLHDMVDRLGAARRETVAQAAFS